MNDTVTIFKQNLIDRIKDAKESVLIFEKELKEERNKLISLTDRTKIRFAKSKIISLKESILINHCHITVLKGVLKGEI